MYIVINRAEDGTYKDSFNDIQEALEYLTMQTGYTLSDYYDYINRPFNGSDAEFLKLNGVAEITDNWGRRFTIYQE